MSGKGVPDYLAAHALVTFGAQAPAAQRIGIMGDLGHPGAGAPQGVGAMNIGEDEVEDNSGTDFNAVFQDLESEGEGAAALSIALDETEPQPLAAEPAEDEPAAEPPAPVPDSAVLEAAGEELKVVAAEAKAAPEEVKRPRRASAVGIPSYSPEAVKAREKATAALKALDAEAAQKATELRAAKKAAKGAVKEILSGPPSVFSRGTAAKKFILDGVRLEDYSPTAQAKRIHGAAAVAASTICALCGFLFEDRVSRRKTKKLHEKCVSYDHFIPVNFAATVLRVVTANGKYSQDEFNLFGIIGDLVCWHCNYEKSQSMFITCPSRDSFDGLMPNIPVINAYYERLAANTHFDAYDGKDPKPTLDKCLEKYGLDKETWKQSRIRITIERAKKVCELIKANVEYTIARQRIRYARTLVTVVEQTLPTDPVYNKLPPEERHDYHIKLIKKKYAEKDIVISRPWKESVKVDEIRENPVEPVPFSPVTPAFIKPAAAAAEPAPAPAPASGEKRGRGGKRRKTYRMRRCRLPKLL